MQSDNTFPWKNTRRFNSYIEFIKANFGFRVQKLSVDAGFTCPNRDGTKSTGGCSYCNNSAFSPSYCRGNKPVAEQILEGVNFQHKRYKRAKGYFVYFQSFSNTYAPVSVLKQRYEQALHYDFVKGIIIGTRPDCINNEILDYLQELNERTWLTLEFGIESCYNKTLERINRGHDFETTQKAYQACAERGIRTGGHMIIGLPGESREQILEQAGILSELPLQQLKFHQLQIVKGTTMGEEYLRNPDEFRLFELDDYLDLMMRFIENLSPNIIIERIAGETLPEYNLNPSWGMRYDQVLNRFEKLLESRNTWQGKYFKK